MMPPGGRRVASFPFPRPMAGERHGPTASRGNLPRGSLSRGKFRSKRVERARLSLSFFPPSLGRERTNERTDGWTDGQTDGRTDGRAPFLAATRGTEYGRHMVGVFGQPNDPTTHSFRGHVIREKVYVSGPRARSSLRARARACTCQLCRTVSRFLRIMLDQGRICAGKSF